VRSIPHPDAILPFPLQNALTRPLRMAAAKAGRAEFLSLWAGQGVRIGAASGRGRPRDEACGRSGRGDRAPSPPPGLPCVKRAVLLSSFKQRIPGSDGASDRQTRHAGLLGVKVAEANATKECSMEAKQMRPPLPPFDRELPSRKCGLPKTPGTAATPNACHSPTRLTVCGATAPNSSRA